MQVASRQWCSELRIGSVCYATAMLSGGWNCYLTSCALRFSSLALVPILLSTYGSSHIHKHTRTYKHTHIYTHTYTHTLAHTNRIWIIWLLNRESPISLFAQFGKGRETSRTEPLKIWARTWLEPGQHFRLSVRLQCHAMWRVFPPIGGQPDGDGRSLLAIGSIRIFSANTFAIVYY